MPATEIPLPTSTPFTYVVLKGDTFSGIALRFNISLDELLAANPDIIPEVLSVGQTLKIPSASASSNGEQSNLPPVTLGIVHCFPSGTGRLCFVPVQNPNQEMLENVKVRITLLGADGQPAGSQESSLLLDILPAGETLPAWAFFPGGSIQTSAVAQLTTAIRLSPGDARYLAAQVQNLLVAIAWDGRSADVQGKVNLPEGSKPASMLWLAGIAYDESGEIVGFRRWEWAGTLQSDTAQPFAFSVYSASSAITRVTVAVEARP
jgi:LysM repeat protein